MCIHTLYIHIIYKEKSHLGLKEEHQFENRKLYMFKREVC